MATIHPISKAGLIDCELRCQGTTLRAWAEHHGIDVSYLCERIERGHQDDAVLHELAETLGVSMNALKPTGT